MFVITSYSIHYTKLYDPVRDEHLWAEKYSGQMEDILEIQEQISRRIVDALKMQSYNFV